MFCNDDQNTRVDIIVSESVTTIILISVLCQYIYLKYVYWFSAFVYREVDKLSEGGRCYEDGWLQYSGILGGCYTILYSST